MPTPSKFFRVAVEGATTDGRNIDPSWITQMAKNFDPAKYGARVWLEHIRGTLADSPFRAYGDVTALKADEVDVGGQKKLALFARIEPTPDLITMTKAKQKIYTSIEINQKFADSGEAYLVGLAVTDSPASLGTEVLQFAAQHPEANPYAARKQSPDNLFSASAETVIEFEEEAENKFSKGLKEIIGKFKKKEGTDESRFAVITAAMGELVDAVIEQEETFASKDALADMQKRHQALQDEFSVFKEKMDKEPDQQVKRPPATGGSGLQTDC